MSKKKAIAAVKSRIDEALANDDKMFECTGEQFYELPKKFYKAIELEVVILRENMISSISEKNIVKMTNLKELEITENLLTVFPSALKEIGSLTLLNLTGNKLSKVPKEIGEFAKLEDLNVSRNPITSISKNIVNCTKLTSLDISHTKLKLFPIDLCSIPGLLKIYYNGNGLSVIPNQITSMVRLKEIYFAENKINNIEGIGSMVKLDVLDVHGNKISSIPNDIGYINHLKTFDCSENLICDLPVEMFNLEDLEYLNLSHNNLSSIGSQIGQLTNLLDLNLAQNNIASISTAVGKLTKLRAINLHENALDYIPAEIAHCDNLEFFEFGGNPALKHPGEGIRREGIKAIVQYFREQLRADADQSEVVVKESMEFPAGEVGMFEILAKDSLGHVRTRGGDRFKVILSRIVNDEEDHALDLDGAVDADKKGHHKGRFYTKISGIYIVSVTLGGKNIRGSPFKIHIKASECMAESTVAVGPGLVHATVGLPGDFEVVLKDGFGNRVDTEEKVDLVISIVGKQGVMDTNVRNNNNGSYTISWSPTAVGIYIIVVKLGDDHIQGSPFKCIASDSANIV